MDRRNFLKFSTAGCLSGMFVSALLEKARLTNSALLCGWKPDNTATRRYLNQTKYPYVYQNSYDGFIGSGRGRRVLLYKFLEKALGVVNPHTQSIGDCVGQGYAMGVDCLMATQIFGRGLAERFEAKCSSESIYGGSKYEIAYLKHGSTALLQGDGSIGLYAAEFLRDYGFLVRKKYPWVDLTDYSPSLAREWGRHGIPDEIEPTIKEHPVKSIALVRSYNECRDAISNGYPVMFCSSFGFDPAGAPNNGFRDSMGFLRTSGEWWHCMAGIGVDDTVRPGVLIINSWGKEWLSGPKRLDQPEGSFWVDAETIDGMCAMGDTFSISHLVGFPKQDSHYDF